MAIKCNPLNSKAYYRAADVCKRLEKWEKALEYCAAGLSACTEHLEPLTKLQALAQAKFEAKKAQELLKSQQKGSAAIQKQAAQQAKLLAVRSAVMKRKIEWGPLEFKYQQFEQYDAQPYFDAASDQMHWPVCFLYPQYEQRYVDVMLFVLCLSFYLTCFLRCRRVCLFSCLLLFEFSAFLLPSFILCQ